MLPLAASVTDGLVHDTSALAEDADLDSRLLVFERTTAGPFGDVVGSFGIRASQAEALRPLVDPEGFVRVALIADGGLLALQEARHAIQDDTWLGLAHLSITLPPAFAPADATRALLDELAFTAPTYVVLPRTGYETALDVLGEDGVERAAYFCGGTQNDLPTDGEVAAFVHGCVDRRVPFVITGGLDLPVRSPGAHGSLNLLAATAAALGGASTNDLVELVESHDPARLLATVGAVPGRTLRDIFGGFATADVGGTITALEQ